MRLRATAGLSFAVPLLLTAGLGLARADSADLSCRPDTTFPAGNPSVYVCGEPGSPYPIPLCYRWGVRVLTQAEGRNCL